MGRIGVQSVRDRGILWFQPGNRLTWSPMLTGDLEFTRNNGDIARWDQLTELGQRVTRALVPLLPHRDDYIAVATMRLGMDIGSDKNWPELFPKVVTSLREQMEDPRAAVEPEWNCDSSSAPWLMELIRSLDT